MPRYTLHMSKVLAAASVNGGDAIAASVIASERIGAARIECLHTAKEQLLQWLVDIDRALAIETAAKPTNAPTINRIRAVVEG
jgi:hypothetical protein